MQIGAAILGPGRFVVALGLGLFLAPAHGFHLVRLDAIYCQGFDHGFSATLAEGFVIWDRVDPAMTRHILRPTGSEGEKKDWTLFSMGLEALVWQFAELVEGADWPMRVGASAGNPE